MNRIVLLPPPAIECPPGQTIVTFDTLVVGHPNVIGAQIPLRAQIPHDPEFMRQMEDLGKNAYETGKRFREAYRRINRINRINRIKQRP